MRIITVSREFGSGGRELGKRLADALGFAYYDKEVITAVAKRNSLDENYVDKTLEQDFFRSVPMTFGHTFAYIPTLPYDASSLFIEQQKIVRELAKKGDCVIVGKNADCILDREKPFKIFVYADMKGKIARCKRRAPEDEKLSDREMEKKIRQVDRARANSHALLADLPWGDRRGYDLCVNTTDVWVKDIVPAVADYARRWFDVRDYSVD
ncbi:MAG: cytidylate kinase-like family protein [Oscillospiraceae bacterium]|nr:cytidylate kinase-like family protein [Oscillospiraceae bacterium]